MAYGLTDSVLTPIARGVVNKNYRVETSEGVHVLKHYRPGLYPREAVQRSCEWQMRLHHAGLPVPVIRLNLDGELLTETPDGFFVVSLFVQGQQYDKPHVPPRAARALGQALGRLHLTLAGLEEVPPYAFARREPVLARLQDLLSRAEGRRGDSPVDEAAYQIIQEKIAALAALPESALPAPQQAQWVHGDYQETNVIFTADYRVAAVLDFDNLRCLPRGIEVMRAFAYGFETGDGPASAAYDFFAGYVEVVPVEEAQVARYASDWTYYGLTRDWPIGVRYLEPTFYDPHWDRFIRAVPNWWLQNHGIVTERFVQILAEVRGTKRPGALRE